MPHGDLDIQGRIQEVRQRAESMRPGIIDDLATRATGRTGGNVINTIRNRAQQVRSKGVLHQVMQGGLLQNIRDRANLKTSPFRSPPDEGETPIRGDFRSIT